MSKREAIISTFCEIGRDLLNLEVNTIEKPNLTGRKMPVLPHALLDIVEYYLTFLTRKLELTSFWELDRENRAIWQPSIKQPEDIVDWSGLRITNGPESFDKLRWAAARALWAEDIQHHFDDSERVVLYRIRRNCDQLKSIIYDLKNDNPQWDDLLNERTRLELLTEELRYLTLPKLAVDYAVVIRKIWDIGTESVLMQTVVQIDGDVITRIQKGLSGKKRTLILKTHELGVYMSLRHWHKLFDIVKEIAGGLIELFLPRSDLGK